MTGLPYYLQGLSMLLHIAKFPSFFKSLNNNTLATFSLSILSVNRYVDCLHILAIVNSAALNTGVLLSL